MRKFLAWGAIVGSVTLFAAVIIGFSGVEEVEADRGRPTQAAYVLSNPVDVPCRADEQCIYALPTCSNCDGGTAATSNHMLVFKHTGINGSSYTESALGGMGRTRKTSGPGITGHFNVAANDGGTGSIVPNALTSTLGLTSATSMRVYYLTAVASNGTDYAEWRLGGAVKNAAGTISAVGSAAPVGTAIAPTNRSTGAKEWRLTPTNGGSGKFQWTLFVGALDGGASPAGDVVFYVEEVTLP